nr:hypothetical protein Iba_chr08fCG0210 [Ipomoea batatas]
MRHSTKIPPFITNMTEGYGILLDIIQNLNLVRFIHTIHLLLNPLEVLVSQRLPIKIIVKLIPNPWSNSYLCMWIDLLNIGGHHTSTLNSWFIITASGSPAGYPDSSAETRGADLSLLPTSSCTNGGES